jgi:MoxR-like ATPase
MPVLRHRVLPNFAADAEGVTAERLVEAVLQAVASPERAARL